MKWFYLLLFTMVAAALFLPERALPHSGCAGSALYFNLSYLVVVVAILSPVLAVWFNYRIRLEALHLSRSSRPRQHDQFDDEEPSRPR